MGVRSAGEGLGATFTLSIPMTRKRESRVENDNHRNEVMHGGLLGGLGPPFQPSLTRQQLQLHELQQLQEQHQQQQSNGQLHDFNNNEYVLVDMMDVFQSRVEENRNDDRVRFGTTVFRNNTHNGSSRGQARGSHVNGTRRGYRHYPQHHRPPTRKSLAIVKDAVPAGGADGDANKIPSFVDDKDEDNALQHPRHTTLPITSHHIQMTQQQLPPPPPGANKRLQSASSSSMKSLYRLLVIDDSHLLVKALRVDGHHCDEVYDVSTAMLPLKDKMFHDNDNGNDNIMYDAVIIATRDGPSICKTIRTLSTDVTIFGVTNTVLFREETRLYNVCGATSVLVKPFDMAFFMDFLSQMSKLEIDNQSNEMIV